MKAFILILIICQFINFYPGSSQLVSFSAKNKTNESLVIDSIKIKNLVSGNFKTINNSVIDIASLNLTGVEDEIDLVHEKFNIAVTKNFREDIITMLISVPYDCSVCISLLNLMGMEIIQKKLFLNSGIQEISLNIHNLSEGIYFIRMSEPKNHIFLKFIKSNSALNEFVQNRILNEVINIQSTDEHEFTVYSTSYFPSTMKSVIPEDGKDYEFILLPIDLSGTEGTFSVKNILADYSCQYTNTSIDSSRDYKRDTTKVLNISFDLKNDYPSDFRSKITGNNALNWNCIPCDFDSSAIDTIKFCFESNKKYQRCESSFIKFTINSNNSTVNVILAQYSDAGLNTKDKEQDSWDEIQFEIKSLIMNYSVNQNGEFIARVDSNDFDLLNPEIEHNIQYYTSWLDVPLPDYHEATIYTSEIFSSINNSNKNSIIELFLK